MNPELIKRISVLFHAMLAESDNPEECEIAFCEWVVDLLNVFEPDANRRIWYSLYGADPNAEIMFPKFLD